MPPPAKLSPASPAQGNVALADLVPPLTEKKWNTPRIVSRQGVEISLAADPLAKKRRITENSRYFPLLFLILSDIVIQSPYLHVLRDPLRLRPRTTAPSARSGAALAFTFASLPIRRCQGGVPNWVDSLAALVSTTQF
jgi:hypothetical protein